MQSTVFALLVTLSAMPLAAVDLAGLYKPAITPVGTPFPIDQAAAHGDDLTYASRAVHSVVWPRWTGIIDVTQPPYNAKGDGVSDDTAALQRAMSDNAGWSQSATLYFPVGTYVVSKQLIYRSDNGSFRSGLTLYGEHRDRTIIRLADASPGFDNPRKSRALIFTANEGGKSQVGAGNMAFGNSICNLTIDIGSGNPGADGIDFQVSNYGVMADVVVRSGDGGGVNGVALGRESNGPGLLRNIRIEGFEVGIRGGSAWVITVEHLITIGQSRCGILAQSGALAIRRWTSFNHVPALVQENNQGQVMLVEARLLGGNGGNAIVLAGSCHARDVTVSGYSAAVTGEGLHLDDWASDTFAPLFPTSAPRLTVEETPEFALWDTTQWANAADFGADPDDGGDDGAAIQAALDSGKPVVVLPCVRSFRSRGYRVEKPLVIPSSVRALLGMNQGLNGSIIVAGGEAQPLHLIGFRHLKGVEHDSPRTLILADGEFGIFTNRPECGKLFIENIVALFRFRFPQQVWARQFNAESTTTKVEANGAHLWILGYKSEKPGTLLVARNGCVIEILGGSQKIPMAQSGVHAAFDIHDSQVLITMRIHGGEIREDGFKTFFETLLDEYSGEEHRRIQTVDGPKIASWANSSLLTRYCSGKPPTGSWVSLAAADDRPGLLLRRSGDIAIPAEVTVTGSGPLTAGRQVTMPSGVREFEIPVSIEEAANGGSLIISARITQVEHARIGLPKESVVNIDPPFKHPATIPHDLDLWVSASHGVVRSADGKVVSLNNLVGESGFSADPTDPFRPLWIADGMNGQPALDFSGRSIFEMPHNNLTGGGPFPEKWYGLAVGLGKDISTRQVLWEQGNKSTGLSIYIDAGQLSACVWNGLVGSDLIGDKIGAPLPFKLRTESSWAPVVVTTAVQPDQVLFVEVMFDAKTGEMRLAVNGSVQATASGITPLGSHSSVDANALGAAGVGVRFHDNANRAMGGFVFQGRIAEFLAVNRVLNDAERQGVWEWMRETYRMK